MRLGLGRRGEARWAERAISQNEGGGRIDGGGEGKKVPLFRGAPLARTEEGTLLSAGAVGVQK